MNNIKRLAGSIFITISLWGSFEAGRFNAIQEANIRLEPLEQLMEYNEYCYDTMFKSGRQCECITSMTHHRCAACDEIDRQRYAKEGCQ